MLERLNGMFAIAIYDRDKNELLLARDRLGKKPLFYWRSGTRFAFASELCALRQLPGFPSALDSTALGLYFRLGWVPGWACIHPQVFKLPPATWLRFHISSAELDGPFGYWSLPSPQYDCGLSADEWLDRIAHLLWDAVRIRLRADVPLGVFLSGGIDSSLVAAAAAQLVGGQLTTLTVGFPGWTEDEWPIAQQTARYLGSKAVYQELPQRSFVDLLTLVSHFDEPFADPSALPTSLVCQAARHQQLTVVLSGDGGDETFAGYPNYLRAWRWRLWNNLYAVLPSQLITKTLHLLPDDSREKRFLKHAAYPVGGLGLGGKLYPFEDWTRSYLRQDVALNDSSVAGMFSQRTALGSQSPIDASQRNDLQGYLVDDVLIKVDRMSMLHSLEVRSPFLDYRLVETALRVPPRLRIHNGKGKYLLRRLAERHLPRSVTRAPKRGFSIPLRQWIFASEHTQALKSLCLDESSQDDVISANNAARLWSAAEHNGSLVSALFRVIAYRAWYAGVVNS